VSSNQPQSGYAQVNGINLYYEIHGTGQPTLLLHGGLGAIPMFGAVLPMLAAGRQIIGVDLQAHGRTVDVDRPIRHETLADDLAALVKHLGIERADFVGYSFGGMAALQTAIRHPDRVRKLVVISAPFRRDGWHVQSQEGMATLNAEVAEMMKQTPMYELYSAIAPRVEDWPVLVTKMGDLMRQDYDWASGVKSIQAPTMIVVGDADSVRISHAAEFFTLLGGDRQDGGWDRSGVSKARLAVLPGVTHYEIFSLPALAQTIIPFLDEPMPGNA
jgi:pimeloyl-ACP methyl ester carboxylesterase